MIFTVKTPEEREFEELQRRIEIIRQQNLAFEAADNGDWTLLDKLLEENLEEET